MAEQRTTRDIVEALRADVQALGRFEGGKPEMTNTDIRNYVLALIEVVDQLDNRLSSLEKPQLA